MRENVSVSTSSSQSAQANAAQPLVSVCIPTFNAAKWILDSLNSALNQSYRPLEILVLDDASTDHTVELVRSIKDPRVKVIVNKDNLGLTRNWNRCVAMCKGEYLKFLLHDDILYPECIERMMGLFRADENIGVVFAPRDIILDADRNDPIIQEWLDHWSVPHLKFGALTAINDGRELFLQYLNRGFRGNWIGEPSAVMIKKKCFDRLGSFNNSLYQICDVEMWLRIMFFYKIGFIPEKLSAFRVHADSASNVNMKSRRNCLDSLWLLESLSREPEIKAAHPEIEALRAIELLRFIKTLIRAPRAVSAHLRNDPAGRQGFALFPTWTKSAVRYIGARLVRKNMSNRSHANLHSPS